MTTSPHNLLCSFSLIVFLAVWQPSLARAQFDFNAAKQSEIVYGIEMKTIESTDDAPWMKLAGTKKNLESGEKYLLDNDVENFVAGKTDYFMISAMQLGDVGLPTSVYFEARGDDGWYFDGLRVDVYVIPGLSVADYAKWMEQWQDQNDGTAIRKRLQSNKYYQGTIIFPGAYGVDTDGDRVKGVLLTKTKTIASSDQKPGISKAEGEWIEVPLNRITSIRLVGSKGLKTTDSVVLSVAGKLSKATTTTEERNITNTQSVEVGYEEGVEGVAKSSVKMGFTFSQSYTNAKSVTEELEKTKEQAQSSEEEETIAPAPDGKVRFVITEAVARVRSKPRTLTVGNKTVELDERVIIGRLQPSKFYTIGSPEIKAQWKHYEKAHKNLLSRLAYKLYVDPDD